MIPSEYLDELSPHQAMAEMEEYIETLENALDRYPQNPIGVRANLGKAGSLAFEVDLVRAFLASFKHTFGTMH